MDVIKQTHLEFSRKASMPYVVISELVEAVRDKTPMTRQSIIDEIIKMSHEDGCYLAKTGTRSIGGITIDKTYYHFLYVRH